MIRLISALIGLFMMDVASQSDFGMRLPLYYTNSCNDDGGRALTCKDGHVIRINDVRCMPYNKTCAEKDKNKIVRLCDGLQTCSYIDLRRQLYLYCKDQSKQVITSFHCVPEDSKPICRTNVCGEDIRDVRCRRGKVFHLLTAKCLNGERDCTSDVYVTIYTTCEGQQTCLISDIKKDLHPGYCEGTYIQQSNIFMDYICVDENVISEKCTGSFQTLIPKFGILRSPGFPANPNGLQIGCYWAIYPGARTDEQVDITVHLSYSKEGKEECDSKFLTVQYKSCEKGLQQMATLCEEGRVNTVIHSCGTVYVMHQPYLAGHNRGNRFLVSYAVQARGSRIEAYESYAHKCEKRYQTPPSTMATLTSKVVLTTDYNKSAITRSKVSEEPLNDSSIPQAEVASTKTEEEDTPPANDPWKLVTLLRVVVVNIFLGLLIIALIMALIFVCYRYRTYGRDKKRNAACKSETATTLDEKNSTEMQLLPSDDEKTHHSYPIHENHHGGAGDMEREPLQEMTSFSVVSPFVSPYETTIFHYNREANDHGDETLMYDTETGLTSFFPNLQGIVDSSKNQNSESAYSSLDGGDDGIQVTDYSEISDNYPKTDCSKHSQLTKVSNQLYSNRRHISDANDSPVTVEPGPNHYEVNNDEYAVINKSPEHRRPPPQPPRRCTNSETSRGEKCCVTNNIHPDPQISHIHPAPEDPGECCTPSTMHVIPEHNCLLHKIPPPPPPAKMPPDLVLQGNNWANQKIPEYYMGSPDKVRQKQSPKHRKAPEGYRY